MSEANEETPDVRAAKVRAIIDNQLEWCRARGINVIPPTVDRATGWAAIEALEDYDYEAVREGREADVRMQLEELARETEGKS